MTTKEADGPAERMENADWAIGRPSRGAGDLRGRTGPEVGPQGLKRAGQYLRWGPRDSED